MKTKSIHKPASGRAPVLVAVVAVVALLALGGAARARAQEIARPKILGIAHAALLCSNIDASRAFFKDYLGFDEPYSRRNPDGSFVLTWIKINDLQQIELFPVTAKTTGAVNHLYQIALITDNCEAMRLYLKSKGWKAGDKPVSLNGVGTRNMTVKDPDGHTIEFVEYTGESWMFKDKGLHMPGTRISPRIRHVGFIVSDVAASSRFYKDILGCTETWRMSREGDELNYINLRLPDCDEYLEFMLYGGAEPGVKKMRSMNHICLESSDPDAAYATLQQRASALPKGCAPPSAPRTGLDRKRQFNTYDPDGTRIELMEPAPGDGIPAASRDAPLPVPDKIKGARP